MIPPQAGEVSLNLRTTKHTAIRVQILNGDSGAPIPGYTLDEALPISGDLLFAQPRWQEQQDLSANFISASNQRRQCRLSGASHFWGTGPNRTLSVSEGLRPVANAQGSVKNTPLS